MMALPGQSKSFERYYKLIKKMGTGVKAVYVFDEEENVIWRSMPGSVKLLSDIQERLIHFSGQVTETPTSDYLRINLKNAHLDCIRLVGKRKKALLTLCVERDNSNKNRPNLFESEEIELLNQGLLDDYRKSIELASQEDELNTMTDELTRRYEELNLIYKSDDQAHSVYHGRELLNQLVQNTPGIIDVDLSVLIIPGKKLTIYKCKNDHPFTDSVLVINYIKESIFKRLVSIKESVIINHQEDASRHNLKPGLPFKLAASPVVNAESEVIGIFALAKMKIHNDFDNSDRNLLDVMTNKASKIVQYNFDALTGLENNRSFELVITEAIKQTVNAENCHAVANIDIDGTAIINNIVGRAGGDRLIKEVGNKIAGMVRSGDLAARLGGDKFGVFLQNCDLIQAQQVMRKIADEIAQFKFEWEDKLHEVSISVGIAPINSFSRSTTGVMGAAESARINGKKIGTNRISILEMNDSELLDMNDQVEWLGRAQAALKNDGFVLYSQLIQPLNPAMEEPHQEILIRMLDHDGGIIAPGMFLPAAERYQLMPKIDQWVINRAFKILKEYSKQPGATMRQVSINLSGQSLSDPDLLKNFIEEKFKQYQIRPSSICFEITESSAIANFNAAQRFIDQMKLHGCRFSLDDFGTGLSSFAYLKNMNVDYLKIDGAFVVNMLEDKVSDSMVSAINQVGHSMGLRTVAEFVENMDIRNRLAEIGVDYGQGYGLGRPIPFEEQLTMITEDQANTLQNAQG
jgi:diguanylate cyclase (GGDEF)-like protein